MSFTELQSASYAGDIVTVRELLSQRAAVHERGSAGSWTALHVAAAQGHLNVVEALLAGNAEVCALDGDGRSALDWAEWRGRGHVVQALQRHERLHRLLDEQLAASQADMSTKLFTAEARLAQLGTELAASSGNSGPRQPAEQLAPFPETGVEQMVESLQQQNALLEQRELDRVDLEQRLKICEQEEHSCKDALVREKELQQHHEGSLRAELEYEKKQFDMLREEHASGLTRAEEEVQRREATWHRERLQCEEAEQRVRALEKACGPGEERLQQCEDMFERECRKRVEAEDCLRERETMEQQRHDIAERAIQKLEQEVAAAEDRAELLQKETVAAEEEARQAQAARDMHVLRQLPVRGAADSQNVSGPTSCQVYSAVSMTGPEKTSPEEPGHDELMDDGDERSHVGGPKAGLRGSLREPQSVQRGKLDGLLHMLQAAIVVDAQSSHGRFAYVVCLWGRNAEYVLGAMVLARSLKRSGTRHDLVALHTNDVPKEAVELLQKAGWCPRQVEYVEAVSRLYQRHCITGRFSDVFTKLRVFSLVEYDKILLMDADLLVCGVTDELFDLEAPAAMGRGPWSGYAHGEQINGSFFFGGARSGPWGWGQSGGINAGVMLLKPSLDTLAHCLAEVADEKHPEHIRGNGPEQDYLSRYFASSWTHISVAYNFQLHQMYYALNPECVDSADRAGFLGCPEKVKIFHYSSDPKPWARLVEPAYAAYSEEEWLEEVLTKFNGYRAWVLKDPDAIEREADRCGIVCGPDGRIHKALGWEKFVPMDAESSRSANGKQEEGEDSSPKEEWRRVLGEEIFVPASAIKGAAKVTRTALKMWEEVYQDLAAGLADQKLAETVMRSVGKDATAVDTASWKRSHGWWVAPAEWPAERRLTSSCSWHPSGPQANLPGSDVLKSEFTGNLPSAGLVDMWE
ncbi:unnamed protein product [Symbiodinium sp. CCMP2456]|nr:unnamed protein product [Symbiodinium sp. CCMP2456]